MLKIRNRIGLEESSTSGLDTPELCKDLAHLRSYSKKISYRYNSRGFRDHEWPDDLSNVVWCVGDSFTVGIGQPFEETWPQILQKKTKKRCINLGEDGCSNDTMTLRIQEIYKLYHPKFIVVMWSYFSRRRVNGKNVQYDKNHFGDQQDFENFIKNYETVNSLSTYVYNLTIPNSFSNTETLKKRYPNLKFVKQLDYARDHHHFDVKTSHGICDLILKNNIDILSKYLI